MKSFRILILTTAVVLATGSLIGCSAQTNSTFPAQPAAGKSNGAGAESVDVQVRAVLEGYLSALNRGAYEEAAEYWSKKATVKPKDLQIKGVTGWYFISSEMIHATATTAHVQLNFSVNVAPGATTNYTSGRNVRYFRLAKEQGDWKIQSMTTSP